MSKAKLVSLTEEDEREDNMRYELVAKETNMLELIALILQHDHGIGEEVD